MTPPVAPLDSLPSLVSAINEAAEAHKSSPQEQSRLALRGACLNLYRELENPPEAIFRLMFGGLPVTATKVAIDCGWLEMVVSAPSGSMTATELAKQSGAEEGLLVRIMEVLVNNGIVASKGHHTYGCTHVTRAFTWPGLKAATIYASDTMMLSFARLPLYLANTGYKQPQDDAVGPFTFAHGRSFWHIMNWEPERRKIFNTFMQAQKAGRGEAGGWLDAFPLEERLTTEDRKSTTNDESTSMQATNSKIDAQSHQETSDAGIPIPVTVVEKVDPSLPSHGDVEGTAAHDKRKADAAPDVVLQAPPSSSIIPPNESSSVLIVDMGGGDGHELLTLHRHFSSKLTGRTILQDLPDSIANSDTANLQANNIEIMPHNFFTPQPVQGAQFYYLASIIHDYPDDKAVQILQNIVPAMKKGHSSIIVVDLVVPETNVPGWIANLDVTLMMVLSGKERTTTQLAVLCERAGLRIRKDGVHMLATGMEGATEIVLVDDERE